MSVKLNIATLSIAGLPPHMSVRGLKREVERALKHQSVTILSRSSAAAELSAEVVFDEGVSPARLADRIAAAIVANIARPTSKEATR